MSLRHRSGFTLFELLIVITLIGVVLALAYPKIGRTAKVASLRTARSSMITALNVTKSSAVTSGKCAYTKLTSSAVTVFTTPCQGGTQRQIVSNRNFQNDYGVTLTLTKGAGSALSADSIGFDPRGVPLNTTQSSVFTITNSAGSRTVSIGNYGMIQ